MGTLHEISGGFPTLDCSVNRKWLNRLDTSSVTIREDKIKYMVDFRAGCYETGQGARHVRQGVAPLQNSLAGALLLKW